MRYLANGLNSRAMKVIVNGKVIYEIQRGTTVKRIFEILGLLENEFLPINPADNQPVTPDFRVPHDGEIILVPVIELHKSGEKII